jgi:transposase
METLRRYPTDLTECQWDRVSSLIPAPKKGGRPAKYARREVVNAVLFVERNRCPWRALPGDLPPWRFVYLYFTQGNKSGVLTEAQP